MSYPIDIDELTERQLTDELKRREELRATGLCDYCCRSTDSAPCKFGDRHRDPRIKIPKKAFAPPAQGEIHAPA